MLFRSKITSTIVTASLFLQPIIGYAFDTPIDLLMHLKNDKRMQETFSEIHFSGTIPNSYPLYISFWTKAISGLNDTKNLSFDGSHTVDIVWNDVNMRVKLKTRIVGPRIFIKIESVSGTWNTDISSFESVFSIREWIELESIPHDVLQQLECIHSGSSGCMMTDESPTPSFINSLFTLEKKDTKTQKVYTIQLTEEGKKMAQELLGNQAIISEMTNSTIQLSSQIITDRQDNFVFSKASIDMTAKDFALRLTGKASPVRNRTIAAPEKFVSIEDLVQKFSQSFMKEEEPIENPIAEPDHEDDWIPHNDIPADEPSDATKWQFDESHTDWRCSSESTTSEELVSLQRTGACPVEKPSRRR